MTPRHHPSYSWRQWFKALGDTRSLASLEDELARRLCEYLGRSHAIFFKRGRDAIHAWFSLQAPGTIAVVPAFTCCVVPEAIRNAGGELVYADVNGATLNMDIETLDQAQPPRGSVIVMTHQWGLPSNAAEIQRWARDHGHIVLEDCAAALGAEYQGQRCGSFGQASILSFENTKLLGAGNLGVLLTDDDDMATRLKQHRESFHPGNYNAALDTLLLKLINSRFIYRLIFNLWSWKQGDVYGDHGAQVTRPGGHYHELPARFSLALVLAQWNGIERKIQKRQRLMAIYRGLLGHEATCSLIDGSRASPIRQPVRVENKRSLYNRLFKRGIDLGWSFNYSVVPDSELKHYPNTIEIVRTILNLPIHEAISEHRAKTIAEVVKTVGREINGN